MTGKRKGKKKLGNVVGAEPVGSRAHSSRLAARTPSPAARGALWFVTAIAAFALVVSFQALYAKEKKVSRVVTGMVLDEGDNGIVGATVVLTDLSTGKKSATYTQESGRYQFADLEATHDYEVQAHHKGLSSHVRKASSFDNRDRIILNLRIPPPKEE